MNSVKKQNVSEDFSPHLTGYPEPTNEDHRLQVLNSYDGLDFSGDGQFDRIVRLAAAHFQVPISLVTLVGKDYEKFAARCGIESAGAPREGSFCAHALVEQGPLIVLDATQDPRFANHKSVVGEPGIRFYAGAPLIVREGVALGTLCVIGTEPRQSFSDEEISYLEDLAGIVVENLELHRSKVEQGMETKELVRATTGRDELAQKAKSQFLSIIGHELRTPINAIQGFASMIEAEVRGALENSGYKEDARNIMSGAQRLIDIVTILETFAQARSGTLTLKEVRVDIRDAIKSCFARVASEATSKNIQLSSLLDDDGSPLLFVDHHYFEQMLSNLLSNAMRFAPEGGHVDVGISVNEDRSLTLWVSDDGPGLDAIGREQALAEFQKNQDVLTTPDGGLGLGLPLTQKLMELHGGKLTLGRGARRGLSVSLTFPAYRYIKH